VPILGVLPIRLLQEKPRDSPSVAQINAACGSRAQKSYFSEIGHILVEACRSGDNVWSSNEEESSRLMQLVSEAIDLIAGIEGRPSEGLGSTLRSNAWPDIYNPTFRSLAFGQPEGSIPNGLAIGCVFDACVLGFTEEMRDAHCPPGITCGGKSDRP
jgi:hypothetical protein